MKFFGGSAAVWLAAATVFITCIVVFYPALQFGFVNWDDIHYIEQDPRVKSLEPASLYQFLVRPHLANWHPLTSMSMAVDYAIWGMDPNGYHLTNILLHAANAVLVFILIHRLYDLAASGDRSSFLHVAAAMLTVALFALHPLRVEPVAWVSARKDVLFAFFYLISIISFLGYRSPSTARPKLWYLTLCLSFILSLMSKPMAVSLPLVLFLLDIYPLRTGAHLAFRGRVMLLMRDKYPLLLLLACSVTLTLWAQSQGGAIKPTGLVPMLDRIPAAFYGYQFYLQKTVWPFDLVPFYPHPSITGTAHPYLHYVTAMALFALAGLIGWKFRTRAPAIGTALMIYVVILLPVIGLVQAGGQIAADRYSYLALIAPVSVLSYFLVRNILRLPRPASSVALVAVFLPPLLLVIQTREQLEIWRDSVSLWNHEIAVFPEADALPYFNRGMAFEALNNPVRAISDYDRAIGINPGHYNALISRGILSAEMERYQDALDDFNQAISINPSSSHAYADRGALHHRMGRFELALADYLRATELNPNNAVAHYNASLVFRQMGRHSSADLHERTAAEIGLPRQ